VGRRLFFLMVSRESPITIAALYDRRVPDKALRIIARVKDLYESVHWIPAILADYLYNEELPIQTKIYHAEYAIPGLFLNRKIPVNFKVILYDYQIKRQKFVNAKASMESRVVQGYLQTSPLSSSLPCLEEVKVGLKKYVRPWKSPLGDALYIQAEKHLIKELHVLTGQSKTYLKRSRAPYLNRDITDYLY
jgi:hypothetical protein